jgi:hypothetical protein
MTNRQCVASIAVAAFAVWWMQAKGYEKGMARQTQEFNACMSDNDAMNHIGMMKHPEYFDRCVSQFGDSGLPLSTTTGRLYEFLIR